MKITQSLAPSCAPMNGVDKAHSTDFNSMAIRTDRHNGRRATPTTTTRLQLGEVGHGSETLL